MAVDPVGLVDALDLPRETFPARRSRYTVDDATACKSARP